MRLFKAWFSEKPLLVMLMTSASAVSTWLLCLCIFSQDSEMTAEDSLQYRLLRHRGKKGARWVTQSFPKRGARMGPAARHRLTNTD